jgi:ADP-dependent NAD(P)H-hydrate dehydratase
MQNLQLPKLPPRSPEAHKGDFGRALLIGGSRGMSGAIALAGMACMRSGAGLVKLAVPDRILDTVASFEPSYMTLSLPCDDGGSVIAKALEALKPHLQAATCVACGPGLSRSAEAAQLACSIYAWTNRPMILDADAIDALGSVKDGLANAAGPRILTPHPAEFGRLVEPHAEVRPKRDHQVSQARDLAAKYGLVIVLKGHETFITDGRREAVNQTGNPGMATGGTGDVLTGVITALICQGLSPFDAAVLGAHVHGLAGDLAATEVGQVSLIASDLLTYLPKAFQSLA